MSTKQTSMPAGPYFVGPDRALDCPDHKDSGLALVDTGRSEDWPIARLCEWGTARGIKLALNHFDAMQEALKRLMNKYPAKDNSCIACQPENTATIEGWLCAIHNARSLLAAIDKERGNP